MSRPKGKRVSFARRAGARALDVASLPGRVLEAVPEAIGRPLAVLAGGAQGLTPDQSIAAYHAAKLTGRAARAGASALRGKRDRQKPYRMNYAGADARSIYDAGAYYQDSRRRNQLMDMAGHFYEQGRNVRRRHPVPMEYIEGGNEPETYWRSDRSMSSEPSSAWPDDRSMLAAADVYGDQTPWRVARARTPARRPVNRRLFDTGGSYGDARMADINEHDVDDYATPMSVRAPSDLYRMASGFMSS